MSAGAGDDTRLLFLSFFSFRFYNNYFVIIFFFFFHKNYIYFFVFRNFPGCTVMFRVPGFIDGPTKAFFFSLLFVCLFVSNLSVIIVSFRYKRV